MTTDGGRATFSERVGGVLVSPRSTLRRAVAAPSGRGAADVGWLIAARLVAGETPRLVRAFARMRGVSVIAGVQSLIDAAATVLPDVVGVLLASMAMSLFVSRRRAASTIDVAAYAWIPYLTVELFSALAFTALGRAPSPLQRHTIDGAALAWSLAVWVLALQAMRAAPELAAPPPPATKLDGEAR